MVLLDAQLIFLYNHENSQSQTFWNSKRHQKDFTKKWCRMKNDHVPQHSYTAPDSHERVGVKEGESIQEHYNTQSSSWNQQLGVPAQPQVVQSHFFSKVTPAERKHTGGHDVAHTHFNFLVLSSWQEARGRTRDYTVHPYGMGGAGQCCWGEGNLDFLNLMPPLLSPR